MPTLLRLAFWSGLCALTVASLIPVAMLPPQALNIWDKAQHALGFAGITVLGLVAYPRHARLICVGLLLWGGAIELMQWASGWRFGEWIDWLADAVGIAAAWLVWHGLTRRTATP
jgi:hypothetical protein